MTHLLHGDLVVVLRAAVLLADLVQHEDVLAGALELVVPGVLVGKVVGGEGQAGGRGQRLPGHARPHERLGLVLVHDLPAEVALQVHGLVRQHGLLALARHFAGARHTFVLVQVHL